jgi:hypothetical protein
MRNPQHSLSPGKSAGVLLAGMLLCAAWSALGQGSLADAPEPLIVIRPHMLSNRYPTQPSQPPAFSIPVEPLGYSAPGPLYLGIHNSLVSLDFLDENRLLFTFRVPGLLHRDADSDGNYVRQIRAMVLALPTGSVLSEALWTLHSHSHYLWMLNNGHFLLRDRRSLSQGDAQLEMKPLLHFPGPLEWLEMDTAQKFLVTDSFEPAATKPDVASQPPAEATNFDDQRNMVVRILHRDSGQVILLSHVRTTIHIPINSEGYLESLRGKVRDWTLNLHYFSGGSKIFGHMDSSCAPTIDFVAEHEALLDGCSANGESELVAMADNGRHLWDAIAPRTSVWPQLVRSPDGSRMGWESLAATHSVSANDRLSSDDIKGQMVEIFDAATGTVALDAPLSPIYDAGGNVAISHSGRRVAVLNAGAIQVFELPAAPSLPVIADKPAAH